MRPDSEEIARMEAAYRRSKWTIIGHTVFLVACVIGALLLRRLFRMPPLFLFVVLVVFLIVFGGDIMKFFHRRNEVRRLCAARDAS